MTMLHHIIDRVMNQGAKAPKKIMALLAKISIEQLLGYKVDGWMDGWMDAWDGVGWVWDFH